MSIAANDNIDPCTWPAPQLVGWVGDGQRVTFGDRPPAAAGEPRMFPMDPREE